MNQKTILVVDDNLGFRLMLQKLLESAGYRVITGEEGQSALEAAWDSRPDLVVSDMDMPINDGYKTIEMFRSDPDLQVPMIIVSGVVDVRDTRLVLDAGASAFFPKPVDQAALLARIAELLPES
ncbi:MAG: response regulator [candidate division WOR-3 bacterium]|nr:response regulator [candidate division WOR-3 bacterium]